MTAREPKVETDEVVVQVTKLVTMQMKSDMSVRWKAVCPYCKEMGKRGKPMYGLTRAEAERTLNEHLKYAHTTEQGRML